MKSEKMILMLLVAVVVAASGVFGGTELESARKAKLAALQDAGSRPYSTTRQTQADRTSAVAGRIATDAEIKTAFISALAPCCDAVSIRKCYEHAVSLCHGDDALISRIAIEIARERPSCTAWTIKVLSKRGSAIDLPFLYSFTNNFAYAGLAAASIVSIEGATSNAIGIAEHVLSMSLKSEHDKYHICSAIAREAVKGGVSQESKERAVSCLRHHVRIGKRTAIYADMTLSEIDHAYETSDERCAFLNAVLKRRENESQRDYATNSLVRINADREQKRHNQ